MRTERLFDFIDGAEGGDFFNSAMDLLFGLLLTDSPFPGCNKSARSASFMRFLFLFFLFLAYCTPG